MAMSGTPAAKPSGARPGGITAMISSTALDLPEHREHAKKACLEAGVFPIGMEELPTRDQTGIDASLAMVDQADIYIGIYASRYGWVPDGHDISITEMEFDHAMKRKAEGKLTNILIHTAHKDHPFKADDVEADKTAQQKLAAFKTRAANGRIRKEFKSPEELHCCILHALNDLKPASSSPAPLTTSIPHNLPSLQPFFGREGELRKIANALDPAFRGWGTLIDGEGGRGKTSLAVRAAYDVPPGQFERIVFVSMKQQQQDDDRQRDLSDFNSNSWMEMLDEIARILKLPAVSQAPEHHRARTLSHLLEGRQILLLLDNLETLSDSDQDQLFTFLDRLPTGCKALLTSRRFAGNTVQALDLLPLDQPTALRLLTEIADHNAAFARSTYEERICLVEETRGNALLLRWVAGQVGHGSCATVADALAHLRSCPDRNDALRFVFNDVVESLPQEEICLLAALSHVAQPMRLVDLIEVSGVPAGIVSDRLKHLANHSLVTSSEVDSYFALVPMVADFLRRAKPEVVKKTGDRLEKQAHVLVMENGMHKYDRFPVLDAAWPTVAAALPRFRAGENATLQTLCDALSAFLNFTGRWDEWLALSQAAEKKAVAAGYFDNAGWRAYNAGCVHDLRSQSAEVLACAERAEAHWKEAKAGARERAIAIQLRGLGHRLAKDYPAAITAFREVVDLDRALKPESEDVASDLNALAGAEHLDGDLDSAERDYLEALRIARNVRDHEGIAIYSGNLAQLALGRGDWTAAEALAREVLPLSKGVGRKQLIAADNHRLAKALARQGRQAEGLPHARTAVEIYEKLGSPYLAEAQTTLAECEE